MDRHYICCSGNSIPSGWTDLNTNDVFRMKHGNLNIIGRIFIWLYYWFDLYTQALPEEDVGDGDEKAGEGSGLQRD